jgi:hypothetical protein
MSAANSSPSGLETPHDGQANTVGAGSAAIVVSWPQETQSMGSGCIAGSSPAEELRAKSEVVPRASRSARALVAMLLAPGASIETLQRRARYGGRKGRRAARRLRGAGRFIDSCIEEAFFAQLERIFARVLRAAAETLPAPPEAPTVDGGSTSFGAPWTAARPEGGAS